MTDYYRERDIVLNTYTFIYIHIHIYIHTSEEKNEHGCHTEVTEVNT